MEVITWIRETARIVKSDCRCRTCRARENGKEKAADKSPETSFWWHFSMFVCVSLSLSQQSNVIMKFQFSFISSNRSTKSRYKLTISPLIAHCGVKVSREVIPSAFQSISVHNNCQQHNAAVLRSIIINIKP